MFVEILFAHESVTEKKLSKILHFTYHYSVFAPQLTFVTHLLWTNKRQKKKNGNRRLQEIAFNRIIATLPVQNKCHERHVCVCRRRRQRIRRENMATVNDVIRKWTKPFGKRTMTTEYYSLNRSAPVRFLYYFFAREWISLSAIHDLSRAHFIHWPTTDGGTST